MYIISRTSDLSELFGKIFAVIFLSDSPDFFSQFDLFEVVFSSKTIHFRPSLF